MTQEQELPDNVVPNEVKTIEGQWYPLSTLFKIEKAKIDTDDNPSPRHTPYKLTIKIPMEIRRGWYPRDFVLTSPDERSYDNFGKGFDDSKDVKRLKQKIRDLTRYNYIITRRNRRLEKRFSKDDWLQMEDLWKQNTDKAKCDYCGKEIDLKKSVEGHDFIYMMEGEIIHLKCCPKMFNSVCSECGICWSEDGGTCSECGGNLVTAKEKEVLEHCQFDALKHYLPKELQDKVVLKKQFKSKQPTTEGVKQ